MEIIRMTAYINTALENGSGIEQCHEPHYSSAYSRISMILELCLVELLKNASAVKK